MGIDVLEELELPLSELMLSLHHHMVRLLLLPLLPLLLLPPGICLKLWLGVMGNLLLRELKRSLERTLQPAHRQGLVGHHLGVNLLYLALLLSEKGTLGMPLLSPGILSLLFLLPLSRPGMVFLPSLLSSPRGDSLDLSDLLYLLYLRILRLQLWRKLLETLKMRILLGLPSLPRLPILLTLLISLRPRPLPGILLRHAQPLLHWRPNLLSLSRCRSPCI